MNKNIFALRYKEQCKKQKISPCGTETAARLGCSRANLSLIMNGKSSPSIKLVIAAAEMLDVSTDYLLGRSHGDQPPITSAYLDDKMKEISDDLESMDNSMQHLAIDMVSGIARHRRIVNW